MRIKSFLYAACAFTSFLPVHANAIVEVVASNGTYTVSFVPSSGKWTVLLHTSQTGAQTTFDVTSDAHDMIGNIVIETDGSQVVFLTVKGKNGQPKLLSVDQIGVDTINSEQIATVVLFDIQTEGDVGNIEVHNITKGTIGGDLTGHITHLPRNGAPSTLERLEIVGNLLGPVTNDFGDIDTLIVGGSIGSASSPVAITVKGRIFDMEAGDIFADISTVDIGAGNSIGRLTATTASGGGGVISGSISTRLLYHSPSVGARILAEGSLDADIFLRGSFAFELSTAEIVMPAGGLTGQIVINGGNIGGVWDGAIAVVKVGLDGDPNQVVLNNPMYSQTAASLGGGSIGLAPFALHGSSSAPVDGDLAVLTDTFNMTDMMARDEPVAVHHYGPVVWDLVSAPVTVERMKVADSTQTWVDITSGLGFSRSDVNREVTITPDSVFDSDFRFYKGFAYRVRPVRTGGGALTSEGVTGSPLVGVDDPLQMGYEYSFTIPLDCPGDLDGDGSIGSFDLAAVVGNWGVCPGATNPCNADINGDGMVAAFDLATVVGSWGVCPPCTGGQAAPGGGGSSLATSGSEAVSPILAKLGFTSSQAYTAWLSTLSAKELQQHLAELLEIALSQ